MGKKIIVTGCAGFIGSHLTEALLFEGHTIYGLDNLSTGTRANMQNFIYQSNFHFFQVDISNFDDLINTMMAIDDAQMVYHLAAMGSVPRSIDTPLDSFKNNVVATRNLLDVCHAKSIDYLIFTSSSSVYGEQDSDLKSVDMSPNPQSPYATYKMMCEQLLDLYSMTYGMYTCSFRLFNVYGPRQAIGSAYAAVVPNICESLILDKPFSLYGNGKQKRDFTYVDNVVEILWQCVDTPPRQSLYNIGCNRSVDIAQLMTWFEGIAEKVLDVHHEPTRKGDVKNSLASISDLQSDFAYIPDTSIRTFLETFRYYQDFFSAK